MQCAFSFSRSDSGQFLVTVEVCSDVQPWFSIGAFPDENEFIQRCVTDVIDQESVEELLAHALLAAANRVSGSRWTRVDLGEGELRAFGILSPLAAHDGTH